MLYLLAFTSNLNESKHIRYSSSRNYYKLVIWAGITTLLDLKPMDINRSALLISSLFINTKLRLSSQSDIQSDIMH